MAAPNIPNEPVMDERGNLTPAWRQFLNELRRISDDHESRIETLEP